MFYKSEQDKSINVVRLVNLGLLTAVFLFILLPAVGINPSIYSPTHKHIFFGDVDLDHDHSTHSHKVQPKELTIIDLYHQINDSIVFINDKDVGNLGLFYIALLILAATLAGINPYKNPQSWLPRLHKINLYYIPSPEEPPRLI